MISKIKKKGNLARKALPMIWGYDPPENIFRKILHGGSVTPVGVTDE